MYHTFPGVKTMACCESQSRREFIRKSVVSGAGIALGAASSFGETRSDGPPFVTCRKDRKLVGVYCSPFEVMQHPEYLDALQSKLGCNVVVLSADGVTYPDDLRPLYPFPAGVNQSIGPAYAEDDEPVHRCAEILHGRGIDMWLIGSGHSDMGYDDSLSPVDFDGVMFKRHTVPKYAIESATGMCFQKDRVLRWQVNAYPWICANYDIDALYLTHHRYNIPSIYSRLWGCACEECQDAASRLGYRFADMRRAMLRFDKALHSLTRERVAQVARTGYSFGDFLQTMTDCDDILAWFDFRSAAFGDAFGRVNHAVKSATQGRCRFIIDTVGPTFMPLVGHSMPYYAGQASDAFYAMAWVDYHYVSVAASWANALCELVPGLDEGTALNAVYRLIGWNDIDLPRERIADLCIGKTSSEHSIPDFYKGFGKHLEPLMRHEYDHAALINVNDVPSYQTVFPHFWGRKPAEPLIEAILEAGHDGYFYEISAEPFVKRPQKA